MSYTAGMNEELPIETERVDDPPVLFTTCRMPPDPAVERKIVSRSWRLDAGSVSGTSNAWAA